MSLIPNVGKKSWPVRGAVCFIYTMLIGLGATMVVPFLITLSSSISNGFDYNRFWLVPRYVWSAPDRFVKELSCFFGSYAQWNPQMAAGFREMPAHWTSWPEIGRDRHGVDSLADRYLHPTPADAARWRLLAADYSEFVESYPLADTVCPVSSLQVTRFLREHYEILWARQHPELAPRASAPQRAAAALQILGETWHIPFRDFQAISWSESSLPLWQQTWFPPDNAKYRDFEIIKQAYRDHYFTPGIRRKWLRFLRTQDWKFQNPAEVFPVGPDHPESLRKQWSTFRAAVAPASPTMPFAMRAVWRGYLQSEEVQSLLQLPRGTKFDVNVYNRLAGTHYRALFDTPFPVPADSAEPVQKLWRRFVETRYPLRLTRVRVTAALTAQYQRFLENRFQSIENVNRLFGDQYHHWDEFRLQATVPSGPATKNLGSVWIDFVKNLPAAQRRLTSSEQAFQEFLQHKYGNLEAIGKVYGRNFEHLEEVFPPFDVAYAITFRQNGPAMTWAAAVANYAAMLEYLTGRSRAIPVTLLLVALSILATLTVNPLAAYALSRFNMKGQDKVLLFLLATTAFPAMVSAIPSYLLMRDLGLLNTFLALVLPGAANGMAIFILKGFFDSMPQELYDAATIDGAKEWQVFLHITLPMMKPILAINALGAFLAAYGSWEWAIIVCQNQKMWTIAVWMYQATQLTGSPSLVAAGFVIVSLPTLLVFLFCQKIILRGIIIPSMK